MKKEDFFIEENYDRENSKTKFSPLKKYRLVITNVKTREGCWSYSLGEVFNNETNELIAEIKRNYGSFPFAFVENHQNGHDYLFCGENYQNQTVVELDTKNKVEHVDPGSSKGHGFCWAEMFPSNAGNLIAVDGCYWADAYQTRIFDISDPMKEIKFLDHDELYCYNSTQWINDHELIVSIMEDYCEKLQKFEDDCSLEELLELEKIEGYVEEDYWVAKSKSDKRILIDPETLTCKIEKLT